MRAPNIRKKEQKRETKSENKNFKKDWGRDEISSDHHKVIIPVEVNDTSAYTTKY